ncbi:MAG: alpha-amylase, partial [Chitinophagaceae bacterium]
LYYGTEILLKGIKNPDGLVRGDFWGGWKEDRENKFTQQGRTEKENEVFNWTRTIANYRKKTPALTKGKMTQYVPQDGVYTFFRYDNNVTVMVVMNANDNEKTITPARFTERINGFTKAKNITEGRTVDLGASNWKVPGKSIWILELQK